MRRIPPALVLAMALTFALAVSPALAAGTVHQVTNAGNDPFAACTAGSGGIPYPRSEVEPYGSVNQANPSNIVTVVQQDRWNNGGAHALSAAAGAAAGRRGAAAPRPSRAGPPTAPPAPRN